MTRFTLSIFLTLFMVSISMAQQEVKPLESWSGKVKNEKLRALVPTNGLVRSPEQFLNLWNGWRPEKDIPDVRFDNELIVVATADGPNIVRLSLSITPAGDLRTSAIATEIGGPGFGYAMARISAEGIKTINGKKLDELPDLQEEEKIEVKIVGKLKFMKRGQEGVPYPVIISGPFAWRVDFDNAEGLNGEPENFNSKQITVWGYLIKDDEEVSGVQRPVVVATRVEGVETMIEPLPEDDEVDLANESLPTTGAVGGTILLPAKEDSIQGATLVISLFAYDPRIADKKADKVGEVIARNFRHVKGKGTQLEFGVGEDVAVNDAMKYYVTVEVRRANERIYWGEVENQAGPIHVLTQENPSVVDIVLRQVKVN